MLARLNRMFVSFGLVAAAYWLYVTLAVPRLEPAASAAKETPVPPPPANRRSEQYTTLFPPDAWQRQNPKTLETEQGVLLFREYQPTADGRMELKPVTLIIRPEAKNAAAKEVLAASLGAKNVDVQDAGSKASEAADADATGADGSDPSKGPAASERDARTIVIDAPEGAQLSFDSPLDLTRARIGRFLGGRLLGEIRIYSPPSRSRADDAIDIRTRNVQLEERRIWTTQTVDFRFGPHHGRGRDLRIELGAPSGARSRGAAAADSPFGRVSLLELTTVEKVFLYVHGEGMLGAIGKRSVAASHSTDAGSLRKEQGEAGRADPRDSLPTAPIEVTSQGPFRLNFQERVASLSERVTAARINPTGPPDQLACELLAVFFRDPDGAESPTDGARPSSETDASESTKLGSSVGSKIGITRFIAQGEPVRLQAPSVDAFAQAESVEYDFTTRRIRLDDAQRVILRHKSFQIQTPAVEYEIPEDPERLGRMWAAGPGDFRTEIPSKDPAAPPQPMSAAWPRELRIEQDGDLRVLSLYGAGTMNDPAVSASTGASSGGSSAPALFQPASVEAASLGRFVSGELHVWLREVAEPAALSDSAGASNNAGSTADRVASDSTTSPNASTEQESGATKTAKVRLQPERMLAVERVAFDSPQAEGNTNRLEVWIDDAKIGDALAPVPPADEGGPPSGRAFSRGLLDGRKSPGSNAKLGLRAETVKLFVLRDGAKTALDEASLIGRVDVRQLAKDSNDDSVSANGAPTGVASASRIPPGSNGFAAGSNTLGNVRDLPWSIVGDELHLVGIAENSIEAIVTGRPANIAIEGVSISGPTVEMDQARNLIWINGGGQMTVAGELLASFDFQKAMGRAGADASPGAAGAGQAMNDARLTNGSSNVITPPGAETPRAMPGTNDPSLQAGPVDARRDSPAANAPPLSPAVMRWTGQMVFDGATLRCEQAVRLEGAHRLEDGLLMQVVAEADSADAVLNRPIDLRRPGDKQDVDVARVTFDGSQRGVTITNRSFDFAANQQSFDQLHAPRVTLEKAAGLFEAAGPGWISTVRYSSDPLKSLQPPSRGETAPSPESPAASASASAVYLKTQLTYVRVDFQRAIIGNLPRREVQFLEQVIAISGPVRGWDETIIADRLERLRPDEKRLTCDRMTIAEMSDGLHRWMEFSATGNAHAEGRSKMGFFTASGQRMSYTEAKDLLVLEGGGREDARLSRQVSLGAPVSDISSRKIEFRPKTNELNLDGISGGSINLGDLPNLPRR